MNLSPDVSPATTDKIDSSPDSDLSVPAPQPNPSAALDLDLDQIEARHSDNGGGYCTGCGLARGGGWRVESKDCEARALVAEVRRLREEVEHSDWLAGWFEQGMDEERGEREAARAEAERLREAWAVRDAADEGMRYTIGEIEADLSNARREINRLRAELDRFKPQPMSQQCRDGRHGQTGDWRCHNCRCLCHTFEHSRAGHDPACESLQREYDRTVGDLAVAVAEAARVREALQAIRELHCECTTGNCACGGGPGWCHGCDESWPCSTIRALDAALDGEPNE